MASAHCAFSFSPLPATNYTAVRRRSKTLGAVCFSSSPSKRKNYLRQKILKTLTKPYNSPFVPAEDGRDEVGDFSETLEIEPEEEETEISSDRNVGGGDAFEEGVEKNDQKCMVSDDNRISSIADAGVSVLSTRSVPKFMLPIVGGFVFATVCAVWVFGGSSFSRKFRNEEGEAELGDLGLEMENVNGGNVSSINLDDAVLEGKIMEIRAMAREARKSEAKRKTNGLGSPSDVIGVDGDETIEKVLIPKEKNNIEKEVDGRLSKLEMKLRPLREKPASFPVIHLQNSSKVDGKKDTKSSNAEVENENLLLKKKKKFKSYPEKPRDHPQGFHGGQEYGLPNGYGSVSKDASSTNKGNRPDVVDLTKRETTEEIQSSSGLSEEHKGTREDLDSVTANEDVKGSMSVTQANEEAGQDMSGTGSIQQTSNETLEATKSKANISGSFKKEVKYKPRSKKIRDKQEDTESDSWWMNLPYVLVILMHKGHDHNAATEPYSLEMDGGLAYTVAFEDRRDATNFCYIVDSCFEDLSDFSTDIVPLSIEEIKDFINQNQAKLLVVRKGQLLLYAGQPLGDVEMAMRTIVG